MGHAYSSKAARVYKSQFPARSQLRHRVGVFLDHLVGIADKHPSSHAEMHDPLSCVSCRRRCFREFPGRFSFDRRGRPSSTFKIEYDVLSESPHPGDAFRFESRSDLRRGRLEYFWLRSKPHGLDDIASDAGRQATGNGFDLREFWHRISLQASAIRHPAPSFRNNFPKPQAQSLTPETRMPADELPSFARRGYH